MVKRAGDLVGLRLDGQVDQLLPEIVRNDETVGLVARMSALNVWSAGPRTRNDRLKVTLSADFCRDDVRGRKPADLKHGIVFPTMARVGVFTRPTPITARAPRPRMTVAVRVSERL